MNGKTNKMRRRLSLFVLAASVAAVAVPTAGAVGPGSPGFIPSQLGSRDRRDTAQAGYTEPLRRGVSDLGLVEPNIPAELRGPVRPDGAALRSAFNELAGLAANSRATRLSSGEASKNEPVSSGFSWRDASIGGGVALLLVALVAFGLAVATYGRKKPLASV